jgi:hypothetical protein
MRGPVATSAPSVLKKELRGKAAMPLAWLATERAGKTSVDRNHKVQLLTFLPCVVAYAVTRGAKNGSKNCKPKPKGSNGFAPFLGNARKQPFAERATR